MTFEIFIAPVAVAALNFKQLTSENLINVCATRISYWVFEKVSKMETALTKSAINIYLHG